MGHNRTKKYRLANKIFIKKNKITLIVYYITDKRSFEELNFWINFVKEENEKEIIIGIAANKIDLYEEEDASIEEGKEFADNNNCLFFEINEMDYDCIENVFQTLVETYIDKLEREEKERERKEKEKEEKEKEDELYFIIYIIKRKKKEYNNDDINDEYLKNKLKEGKRIMK